MYKKNIAVYDEKMKQTRELCVRACVCLSVSLSVPLRAQYVQKPKNNFAKMNEEKKKIIIKKEAQKEKTTASYYYLKP
jgi:hypothetical protein